MPKACVHFTHLASRFAELRQKFIDSELAAETANPATFQADLDHLAAFRLLMHAEFEHFLENKAKEILGDLEVDVIGGGNWQRRSPQLLSLYLVVSEYFKDELTDARLKTHFATVIRSARKLIKDNNGIKEQSFIKLSVMAGKTLDEIDSTTAALLNSYGKDRGEVAHNSVRSSRTLSAPSTELTNATAIVTALSSYFDVQ